MSDDKHERSEAYGKARSAFDGLSMDERASFLVDSVVAMMAEGVGQAGKVVSSVLDDLAEKLDDCCKEETAADSEAPKGQAKAGKKAPSAGKKTPGSRRAKPKPKAGGGTA